jgi:hypothetical protein
MVCAPGTHHQFAVHPRGSELKKRESVDAGQYELPNHSEVTLIIRRRRTVSDSDSLVSRQLAENNFKGDQDYRQHYVINWPSLCPALV